MAGNSIKKYRQKKKRIKDQALELWKEIILKEHNYRCELCGNDWKITAHHFYFRSSAGHLILDIDNGICLCGKCHAALHWEGKDQKLVEDKIIEKRGQEWLARLKKKEKDRPGGSFKTLQWYQKQIQKLNE